MVVIMCEKKELSFSIFVLYSLAEKWKMSPAEVYKILNTTGIYVKTLYLIFDYPYKYYTFKHFEV